MKLPTMTQRRGSPVSVALPTPPVVFLEGGRPKGKTAGFESYWRRASQKRLGPLPTRKCLCRFSLCIEQAIVGERKHSSGNGLGLESVLQKESRRDVGALA